MRHAVAALVVAATLASPSLALADASAAQFHNARARRFYAGQRYEDAVREFFLAHRHAPSPRLIYNIAVCFRFLRRWDEAFLHYSEYLASEDEDAERRSAAEEALEEIGPRVARVRVETTPPGVSIYVDEGDRGTHGLTPGLIVLPPGDHDLLLRREGFEPLRHSVSAIRGREVGVSLALTRITGTLRVTANAGSTVELRTPSGSLVAGGETPFELDLAPGAYAIEAVAEGHEPARELVVVEPREVVTQRMRLRPLPEPTGTLTVTSNVPGAEVSIDDRPAGFTPLVLDQIGLGESDVRVEADGLAPWNGPVEVTLEERSWLTVTLEPPPSGEHSFATWLLGGAGLAALANGVVFGSVALERLNAFEAGLVGTGPRLSVAGTREEGIAYAVTADVSFGVGAAVLAAGVIAFIVEELTQPEQTTATFSRSPRQ